MALCPFGPVTTRHRSENEGVGVGDEVVDEV